MFTAGGSLVFLQLSAVKLLCCACLLVISASYWCGWPCVTDAHMCRFMSKYHPTFIKKQKDDNVINLKRRLAAFQFLLESGRLDNIPLSTDCSDKVTKVMDAGK